MAYPVQGFGRTRLERYIAIGGDWDEFSAAYNNDTTAVTVSSNGVAKNYGVYGTFPSNPNNPLANYFVLVIQVSGYITLASGASSGSATVSVVLNGYTLYSTTITNTTNQVIINNVVIPYSQFAQYYVHPNASNSLQITVTLGTGAQSVTITQVQYMFGILINGGSSGVTINIPINQAITLINDDPTNIYPYYVPDVTPSTAPAAVIGNPFGLGVTFGIYDPFGITTGHAQISLQNGTAVIYTNGNAIYQARAFPVSITTGTPNGVFGPQSQTTVSDAILTISVPANNSILIGYYDIAIIVGGLAILKGYVHQMMYFRATSLSWWPIILFINGNIATFSQQLSAFNPGFATNAGYLLPETAIWGASYSISSVTDLLNQFGAAISLSAFNFNWSIWQAYAFTSPLMQIGNATLYKLNHANTKFVLTLDHIAAAYIESVAGTQMFSNIAGSVPSSFGGVGYILARIVYVEVEE